MNDEFLVFLDETGDHSLQHIDKQYPIFALGALFCRTDKYIDDINPAFDKLKYSFFGKRHVILHSTDIRKSRKEFNILMNKQVRDSFFQELNKSISDSKFVFTVSLIDKLAHTGQYVDPENPYDLTLSFIMERAFFLISKNYPGATCRFIAESRDNSENKRLLQTFMRYKQNGTSHVSSAELNFISSLEFVNKSENETGHQIVDLCLYPFARTYLNNKCHPSLPVYYPKIYKNPRSGSPLGYGIKTFPVAMSTQLIQEIESSSF